MTSDRSESWRSAIEGANGLLFDDDAQHLPRHDVTIGDYGMDDAVWDKLVSVAALREMRLR